MKVLITSNSFGKFSYKPKEYLVNAGFEIIENPYNRMMTENEVITYIKDVDAIILSTEQINQNVIDHAKKLKVISRYGVGTDNIDKEYCKQKGIIVTVTKNSNTNAVAEYTVALMLSAARGICFSNNYAKQNEWKKFTGLDLTNKVVGIVGLGSIGREVVKKISGFNVQIIAYDIFYDEEFITKYQIKKVTLNELLIKSDFISLHLPAVDNKPLIAQPQFEMMKNQVVLVNTARASLIDSEALVENLKIKKIFAVALDVHPNEPQFEHSLISFENVILTPHNAAVSKEAVDKMSMLAVQNILDNI